MGFEERPERRAIAVQNDRSPSEAVIWTVAEAADVDPLELDSLHAIIDPDALNTLVERDAFTAVTFEYHGYTVTVRADGEIVVQEPTSPEL